MASPAKAAEPPAQVVTCIGQCVTFLDPGTYRVVVEGTAKTREGARTVSIEQPGDYLIEGQPRGRSGAGLFLGSMGITMGLVGGGILLGGGGFDSHLSARQERWFWAGTGIFGAGLALLPIGFLMANSSPEVAPLKPVSTPAPRLAEPIADVRARPRAPTYNRGSSIPSGYQVIEEPRWGLLRSGAILLSSSYGIVAGVSAGTLAHDSSKTYYAKGFIPIIGPLLIGRNERSSSTVWTIYGTVPQLAGGVLLFAGAMLPKQTLVRLPAHAAVTPWASPTGGGVALGGNW